MLKNLKKVAHNEKCLKRCSKWKKKTCKDTGSPSIPQQPQYLCLHAHIQRQTVLTNQTLQCIEGLQQRSWEEMVPSALA